MIINDDKTMRKNVYNKYNIINNDKFIYLKKCQINILKRIIRKVSNY